MLAILGITNIEISKEKSHKSNIQKNWYGYSLTITLI